MVTNFTPLNIEKLKSEKNNLNTVLLLILILTMAVLAVILFILIQRKINEQKAAIIEPTPTIEIRPTDTVMPTLSPTIFQEEMIATAEALEASETGTLSVTPTTESGEINY